MMQVFNAKKTPYEMPAPSRHEVREIEKAFARLFSTNDGKIVLSYLHAVTFSRAAGIDATDFALRYMEGQRSLMAQILRLIERGQN